MRRLVGAVAAVVLVACGGGSSGGTGGGSGALGGAGGGSGASCSTAASCPAYACSCADGTIWNTSRACLNGVCLDEAQTCATTCQGRRGVPPTSGGGGGGNAGVGGSCSSASVCPAYACSCADGTVWNTSRVCLNGMCQGQAQTCATTCQDHRGVSGAGGGGGSSGGGSGAACTSASDCPAYGCTCPDGNVWDNARLCRNDACQDEATTCADACS